MWSEAINNNSNSLFLTVGPGDFLIHHAIALGLHTTTLIQIRGLVQGVGFRPFIYRIAYQYNLHDKNIITIVLYHKNREQRTVDYRLRIK